MNNKRIFKRVLETIILPNLRNFRKRLMVIALHKQRSTLHKINNDFQQNCSCSRSSNSVIKIDFSEYCFFSYIVY